MYILARKERKTYLLDFNCLMDDKVIDFSLEEFREKM